VDLTKEYIYRPRNTLISALSVGFYRWTIYHLDRCWKYSDRLGFGREYTYPPRNTLISALSVRCELLSASAFDGPWKYLQLLCWPGIVIFMPCLCKGGWKLWFFISSRHLWKFGNSKMAKVWRKMSSTSMVLEFFGNVYVWRRNASLKIFLISALSRFLISFGP